MKTVKVQQIRTKADAHLVVRDSAGRKIFEVKLPGVTVVLAVASDAAIDIAPSPVAHAGRQT
jgi:hypothetical protein